MKLVGDIEGNNLLNHQSINYLSSPYKLKDSFKIHCASFIDIDTEEEFDFDPSNIDDLPLLLKECSQLVFHNGIGYDYLAMKLYWGLSYYISDDKDVKDLWEGRDIQLDDTLVMSKVLNPDRFGGHSIEAWGKRFKFEKIDWRKRAEELGLCHRADPKGAEFKIYHPEMLTYCKRDAKIGLLTYKKLIEEWGDWDWSSAYNLEKKVADIVTRQEHRGFYFYKDRAEEVVKDLDARMEEIASKVEPLIPAKKPTQTVLNDMRFPAKPFKKDGTISSSMEKWIDKQKAERINDEDGNLKGVKWLGKEWYKPFPTESVVTEVPATLKDSTHIKEWLITQGWIPTSFKERDLTLNQKKIKLTQEQFEKTVERYIKQTLDSKFKFWRCEHLKVDQSEAALKRKLLNHDRSKPLKVLTNPTFTVGQEKELCPGLVRLKSKFPYAEDVVHWLTYNHRRNSILGGGLDWDEEEEAEKGYLSQERINVDGRIPTPADTCGCNTSRFKHRVVANIPRVSSLYGEPLRSLFGCDPDNCLQIGYDFAGLEGRIEAAYTYKYPGGRTYAQLLISDKPNDLHTANARKLGISRDEAKTVKYALSYGSQPESLAKNMGWTLARARKVYNDFWEAAKPLKLLKERLEKYWENNGKKFILGLDGRKIPVRSKHSLINALFQSAGVICAKRAMVIQEQKLKEKGLLLDFFRDDWKNKPFVQQMIGYHDEAQEEVTKDLVQMKSFKSEKDAEKWKGEYQERTNKILSNVIKKGDRYWVGYSIAGHTAVEAARESGDYYNLDVKLDSDYMVGRDWAQCH